MKPLVSLREALADPHLLGGAMPGESWAVWRTLLIASVGEPLTTNERAVFAQLTGRDREPGQMVEELWAIVGRRGGKTRAAATLGAYIGTCLEVSALLAPGERAVIPVLAASQKQASRAFAHIRGVLEHSPELSRMIASEPTADTIRLTEPVDIEVQPANFRTIRSITAAAAICDEVAFWQVEGSANPDAEILNALRPALATTGGPLVVISSPYAKKGELWEAHRQFFGPNGDPLVVVAKAPSRTFNPTLSEGVVARALARDRAAASAEYLAEFRDDVADFITRDIVEACVSTGVRERARQTGVDYEAFTDPSGGVADAFTLAIGHREGDLAVLDVLRERRPPFSPEQVVADYAKVLTDYGVSAVTGDRYAGEWPREQFRKHGVEYQLSDRPRSDLYRDLLPILNSRQAKLLDSTVLVDQIAGLERRVARGGRESIDHAPNAHDDLANSAAGVLVGLVSEATERTVTVWLPPRLRGGMPAAPAVLWAPHR